MNNDLIWQSFGKDDLPAVFFGESPQSFFGRPNLSEFDLDTNKIAVGFSDSDDHTYRNPSLVVAHEKNLPDLLSWLKVYAPETSPLSQLTRVISFEDWKLLNDTFRSKRSACRPDQWACLTLGEVLAQGDSETEISSVPLSRVQACFTSTIAKCSIFHRNKKITETCIGRLKALETDNRFVKRSITVDELVPIWEVLSENPSIGEGHIQETILEILNTVTKPNSNERTSLDYPSLRAFSGLLSDSIEERVITFNKISNILLSLLSRDPKSLEAGATLAAAAFLVGRSTSHIFLLRRFSKEIPSALAWFGLFAAYAGPTQWDPQWARAVKSAERSFQSRFDLIDPTQVDLCWPEFLWISRTFKESESLADLPKMLPKVLSVEVFPGASCQFRLSNTSSLTEADRLAKSQANTLDKELQQTISELIHLAIKAKGLVDHGRSGSAPQQSALDLGEDTQTKRETRPKRGGRSSSKV